MKTTVWTNHSEEKLPTFRSTNGARNAYVSAYSDHPASAYNWQVYLNEFTDARLSGSLPGLDDAKVHAEHLMALPDDEFNALIVGVMTEKLNEVAANILKLSPTAQVLPGFSAGVAAERHRIETCLSDLLKEFA